MKTWIIVLISTLAMGASAADRVGQGAGISENNIQFAYGYMDHYLRFCLASKDCAQDDKEKSVLEKILNALPSEYKTAQQIVFKSHFKDGIFLIDGKVRVAKTFAEIGSQIYFNLDQLYTIKSGVVEGISIQTAISLLVHEFGHHHGIVDHDWLDSLGQRVANMLSGKVHSNMLSPEKANIEATSIYFEPTDQLINSTQVMISDGPNLFDLGPQIQASFRCPPLKGRASELVGLTIWNLTWREMFGLTPTVVAFAKPFCRTPPDTDVWTAKGYGVQIQVRVDFSSMESAWRLHPTHFYVRQVTCAEEPLMCGWGAAEADFTLRLKNMNPKTKKEN